MKKLFYFIEKCFIPLKNWKSQIREERSLRSFFHESSHSGHFRFVFVSLYTNSEFIYLYLPPFLHSLYHCYSRAQSQKRTFNWSYAGDIIYSWVWEELKTLLHFHCQARVRSPKVQSPKVKTKRTRADTIITRLPYHRHWLIHHRHWLLHHRHWLPPITPRLWLLDQVDSEIKDVG